MEGLVRGAKAFGKAIWEVLGEKKKPTDRLRASGAGHDPTSNFVCDRAA